jgi:hypothetical protein
MYKIPACCQRFFKKALTGIESGEPINFIGMGGSGVNYFFKNLPSRLDRLKDKKIILVFVDLSGSKARPASEIKKMVSGFGLAEMLLKGLTSFSELYARVYQICQKKKIVLIMNLGYEAEISQDLLEFLSRLRNALSWRFSYVICANPGLLRKKVFQNQAFEKLIKCNLVPILPYSESDAKVVLTNYENRYQKKLPPGRRKKIIELSGGNPGLIKGLYLQASEKKTWPEPDFGDERLQFRLQRLLAGLSEGDLKALKKAIQGQKIADQKTLVFLKRFGYLTPKREVFSSLLKEAIDFYYSTRADLLEKRINLYLSRTQREVLKNFQDQKGKIISRDEIAKILWGKDWTEKYSDWALDQYIHGLRVKLKKLKLGKIKTKKGEGFVYLNHSSAN